MFWNEKNLIQNLPIGDHFFIQLCSFKFFYAFCSVGTFKYKTNVFTDFIIINRNRTLFLSDWAFALNLSNNQFLKISDRRTIFLFYEFYAYKL